MSKSATCFWCGEFVVDGKDVSGYTGPGSDWATLWTNADGEEYPADFGCDAHPLTNMEDGCGSHQTETEVIADYKRLLGYETALAKNGLPGLEVTACFMPS
jgi:hypothetical protein